MKRLHRKDGKPFVLDDITTVKVRKGFQESEDKAMADHVVVVGGPANNWEICWLPYQTYEHALAGAAEIIAAVRKALAKK